MPEPNKEKPAVWIALAVIVCIALLGAGILAGRATTGGGSGPPGPSSYGGGGPPGASKPTYQVTDDDLRDWGEVQRLRERQKMAVENYERFGR